MKQDIATLKKILDSRNLPAYFSQWITEQQLLKFLDIKITTLRNWRSQRKIEYTKMWGIILYSVDYLIAKLEKGRVKGR
jgi:hypothetical protein